ncbi:MAG TPA: hypothetical protein VF614_08840, partial [Chthoniobacteraceae bacterium]
MIFLRDLLSRAAALAACAFLLSPGDSAAHSDHDHGAAGPLPDVWAMLYEAGGLPMTEDSDGDGHSNALEVTAGTNPRRPDSKVRVSRLTRDANGLRLEFPSQPGKRYQAQGTASLDAADWQNVGSPVLANAAEGVIVVPPPSGGVNYYRVIVQDVDSDGDQVTDWEERVLGFNPHDTHSGGLNSPDDLTAITQAFAATNTVSLAAADEVATEPANANSTPDSGAIVIRRSGNLNPVTVRYAMSGSAAPGADYEAASGSVTLGLGVRSVTVNIRPLADAQVESSESAVLTITPDAAYTMGGVGTAAVIISDDVRANGQGLTAEFFNEATSGATQPSSTNPPRMTNRVLLRDGLGGRPAPDALVGYDYTVAPWPGAPVNATYFASRWSG